MCVHSIATCRFILCKQPETPVIELIIALLPENHDILMHGLEHGICPLMHKQGSARNEYPNRGGTRQIPMPEMQ